MTMKLWVAEVGGFDVQFDPALHCREEADGYSFRFTHVEGQAAEFEIERDQTGYSRFLRFDTYYLVSYSLTGLPANAKVLCKGRVYEIPSDLFGFTQTLRCICAPEDLDQSLIDYAQQNLDFSPYTDWLLSDADRADPAAYLLGWSRTYYVQPSTLTVLSIDDIPTYVPPIHLVDLRDHAIFDEAADGPGYYEYPLRNYRATVEVTWTQEASGTTDIAPLIPNVMTMNPTFADTLQGAVTAEDAEGWTVKAGIETIVTTGRIGLLDWMGTYNAALTKTKQEKKEVVTNVSGNVEALNVEREEVVSDVKEDTAEIAFYATPVAQTYTVDVRRFPVDFTFAQPRKEVAYISLDAETDQYLKVAKVEDYAVELSLKDIFEENAITAWESDKDYVEHDLVRQNNQYYECVQDHRSTLFEALSGSVHTRPIEGTTLTRSTTTYWIRTFPDLPNPESTSRFLQTPRGRNVYEHVLMRLRKEARRRLRARHVNLPVRFEDAPDLSLLKSAIIKIPWGDGTWRDATGRVIALELNWDGQNGPMWNVEIGLVFGDGFDERPYTSPDGPEFGVGLFDVEYTVYEDSYSGSNQEIDPSRLDVAGYALEQIDVGNDMNDQLANLGVPDSEGRGDTYLSLKMKSLAAQDETVRVLDIIGMLKTRPRSFVG